MFHRDLLAFFRLQEFEELSYILVFLMSLNNADDHVNRSISVKHFFASADFVLICFSSSAVDKAGIDFTFRRQQLSDPDRQTA